MRRGIAKLRTGMAGAGLMLALSLSACPQAVSDNPAQAAAREAPKQVVTHPESGLEIVPLVVKSKAKVHRFRVEMARSRYEQAQGMMFRTKMGPDEGMLFPFAEPRQASFWMSNTVIPLDIIFIDAKGRILNVGANAAPYSEDKIESQGRAAAVLELIGGRAAQLGIGPGDKVEW